MQNSCLIRCWPCVGILSLWRFLVVRCCGRLIAYWLSLAKFWRYADERSSSDWCFPLGWIYLCNCFGLHWVYGKADVVENEEEMLSRWPIRFSSDLRGHLLSTSCWSGCRCFTLMAIFIRATMRLSFIFFTGIVWRPLLSLFASVQPATSPAPYVSSKVFNLYLSPTPVWALPQLAQYHPKVIFSADPGRWVIADVKNWVKFRWVFPHRAYLRTEV